MMIHYEEILVKDLSSRLGCGTMLQVEEYADLHDEKLNGVAFNHNGIPYVNGYSLLQLGDRYAKIKPYLRPMDDMNDDEKRDYETLSKNIIYAGQWYVHLYTTELNDWLNRHHFDYNGLIEQGLAVRVTQADKIY